jgi:hypothetical protein
MRGGLAGRRLEKSGSVFILKIDPRFFRNGFLIGIMIAIKKNKFGIRFEMRELPGSSRKWVSKYPLNEIAIRF